MKLFFHIGFLLILSFSASAEALELFIWRPLDPMGGQTPVHAGSYADSVSLVHGIREFLYDLQEDGFLAASLDSLIMDSARADAYIYKGERFDWGRLSLDSIDREVLRKSRIRKASFSGKAVRPGKLVEAMEKILTYSENNGYPFAVVRMDNLSVNGDSREISADLFLERNQLFLYDSLFVKGEAKISPEYLQRHLGIREKGVYSERSLRAIPVRIRETGFLEEIRPFELEFHEQGTDVYTYLKKGRANQFNGIIGVLPNYDETGKLLVTGDLNLYLINSFGKGEAIDLRWKKLEPFSQQLNMKINLPYIFSSAVGIGVDFHLLKQDTTYISLNPLVDLKFYMTGTSYFYVYIDYFNSSVISTYGLEDIAYLPSYADITSALYGIGISHSRLDYLYNPSRGWWIRADLGAGSRKIRKNPGISEEAYTRVNMSSTKWKGEGEVLFFQPLTGSFVLHLAGRTGYIHNPDLFENEMFRLGGIGSVRGLNEQSVYASSYGLFSLETRFLFDRNSAFYLFADGGYYEKKWSGDFLSDFPVGFGAGLNLQTKAGIFSLNYALGKEFDNPVSIGNAKIHIGYVNRF